MEEDYKQITETIWFDKVDSLEKPIFFNDIERMALIKMFKSCKFNSIRNNIKVIYEYCRILEMNGQVFKIYIDINKLEDEWYLVYDAINRTYYLCDQLYGLKKCLEDINGRL